MSKQIQPTGIERSFAADDLIVSKTDPKGRLTYVNEVFIQVSGYSEREMIGQPHSVIRHPDMPRCIFKLLWDRIGKGMEVFAYVNNLCADGDHYWVLAHVTPTFDDSGNIIGYHSNRRVPPKAGLAIIKPLYAELLAEERRNPDRKIGLEDSFKLLLRKIEDSGHGNYDRLIFALSAEHIQ